MPLVGLTCVLLFTACGPKADPRIGELESRLGKMEARVVDLEARIALDASLKRVSAPSVVTRVESPVTTPAQAAAPSVIAVTGRVTEQNSTWWKWSYILSVANTNDGPLVFDARIQFLDADGFVVDQNDLNGLTLGGHLTNRIAGYALINTGPAAKVKNLKALVRAQ